MYNRYNKYNCYYPSFIKNRYNCNYLSYSNLYNCNNSNNINDNNNNYNNINYSTIPTNLKIIYELSLNQIYTNNLYTIDNCIYTYKFNKLVLLKSKNKKYGFFTFNVPEFSIKTSKLYILLNIKINNKYSSFIKILNKNGILNNFDLLNKTFYLESFYENQNLDKIKKEFTIYFSDESCIIEDINIYFLGVLSEDTIYKINNSTIKNNIKIIKEFEVNDDLIDFNEIKEKKKKKKKK